MILRLHGKSQNKTDRRHHQESDCHPPGMSTKLAPGEHGSSVPLMSCNAGCANAAGDVTGLNANDTLEMPGLCAIGERRKFAHRYVIVRPARVGVARLHSERVAGGLGQGQHQK